MNNLEQSIPRMKSRKLKKLIAPIETSLSPNFTRKVAEELRWRGYRVSLKHGTVKYADSRRAGQED